MLGIKFLQLRAHRCLTISTTLLKSQPRPYHINEMSLPSRLYSNQGEPKGSPPCDSSIPTSNTTATKENVNIAKKSKQILRDEHIQNIDDLLQARQLNEAVESFFAHIDKYSPPPRLYDALINDCLNSNKAEKAYEIYRKQYEKNPKIPQSTVERLILQCDEMTARSKKLKHLRKTMAVNGFKMNAKLYNAMIRCYIGDDQWKVGLSLADTAVSNGFAFDADTMNYLLAGYGHVEIDGFYRCLEIWHEMKRMRSKVNTFGMNGLLRSIRNCEHFDMVKMLETLDRIKATVPSENGHSQGNVEISGENEISQEHSSEIPVDTSNDDKNSIRDDGRPELLADPRKIGRLFPLGSVTKPQHILLVLGGLSGILRAIKSNGIEPNEETILTLLTIAPNTTAVEEKMYTLMKQHRLDSNEEQFMERLLERRCMRQDFKATLVRST